MNHSSGICGAAALVLSSAACLMAGSITMPSIFSENMVLQRDVPIPVWGWAPDGAEITVMCGAQKVTTTAAGGQWRVMLAPLKAGGPYTFAVMGKDISDTVMCTQVLAGEVWMICGQSNAMMPLNDAEGVEQAIADRLKYPNLRVVQVGRRDSHTLETPQTLPYGYWGPLKWESAAYMVPRSSRTDVPGCVSALGYFFGRELYQYLKGEVPVGIVEDCAILPVEAWIDDATVAETPALLPLRGKGYPNATSRSFNANIAPLVPFPVRGVIYYQGEMNSGRGTEYRQSLPALIRSWRKSWGNAALPFIIVQLPGFVRHLGPEDKRLDMDAASLAQFQKENAEHGYCGIREAQLLTCRSVPHTALAVTIDLGDKFDIHPRRKLPVAQRVFLQARKLVYGEKELVAGGPVPLGFEVRDGRAVVSFEGVGGGLVAQGGDLKGFEVSADGKLFVPAQALIKGDRVEARSADVPKPLAVRYAWAGFPEATLFNREGLPATPFRYPVPE